MKGILFAAAAVLLSLLTVTTLELLFDAGVVDTFLETIGSGMRSNGKGVEKCGSANA